MVFVQDAVRRTRQRLNVDAVDAFQTQLVKDAANTDQDSFHVRFHVGCRVFELGFVITRRCWKDSASNWR